MSVNIRITNYAYLCSVPREVVPGGAMSVYSDDILDVDPTLHHMKAAKKRTHTMMTSQKYRNTMQVTKAFVAVLTLALMMVGRGSSIPCIFLNAGMTKRLQVTTADTGLPERERRDDC